MCNKIKRVVSGIRLSIRNKTLFKHIFYRLFVGKKKDIAKRELLKQKMMFNYKINVSSPRSFNEYLLWIKYNYSNDLWRVCADKLKCKEYLASRGFANYLPKTLGVYKTSSEINLDALPNRFVLKTNNDSGSVYLCEKGKTNFSKVFEKIDQAISRKYSTNSYEWVYDSIEPLIFAEEKLIPSSNTFPDLVDYKFFTFNHEFKFGFVACRRNIDPRFTLFEKDYNIVKCDYIHLMGNRKNIPNKPKNFDKMVELAENIAKDFDFVRVDLYDTTKGPMIGELTFISMSGFGIFTKKEYDFKYGKYFENTIFKELAYKTK